MASKDSDLLKVLECPICTETYEEPKVVESCKHSFCENCLRTYIQTAASGGEFPCPVCREKCRVPLNGVDDGFTTNVTLAAITDKYNDIWKGLKMKWKKCSFCIYIGKNVEASLICPQCRITFCDDCGREHKDNRSHDVISLCGLHGKPLEQFCTNCDHPICVVCFGKHVKKQQHTVINYKDWLKTKKDESEEGCEKIQAANYPLMAQGDELKEKQKEKEKMMGKATANFSATENVLKEKILTCSKEAEYLRSKLELVEREKVEHEGLEKSLPEMQQHVLDRNWNTEKNTIKTTIKDVRIMKKKIQTSKPKREELSEKLLKVDLSENMTRRPIYMYTRIMELADASKKDWVTPFGERMKTNDDLCEEYAASAGRFSSASLSFKLKVPDGSGVKSVAFLTKDRIAAAVKVCGEGKVLLWDLPSLPAKVIMQEEGDIRYITALGQDHLVVLRRRSPILTVMDVVRDTKREIDMKLSDEAIKQLWSVEGVSHGNFLVSYGETDDHIVLIDSEGKVLQDIETGRGYRLAFCRITGMVVICANTADTISCYQVGENSLTKVMSVPHGVKRFLCYDICSGSFGEVFIVGRMEGDEPRDMREVRVYQPDIDADKKTVSMKQTEINGEQMRSNNNYPKCSLKGNRLLIGYDNKVDVLDLLV